MRRRLTSLVHAVSLCLALSGAVGPAQAGGLISTERAAQAAAPTAEARPAVVTKPMHDQRARLQSLLVQGGVKAGQATQRLAALSDAEVAELSLKIDSAPAGGLWFMPFLVVAAVIGVLIGSREAAPAGPSQTDLFGRPRNLAATAP